MNSLDLNLLGPERSLINVTDAEWRTREINIMSLVRSFLSQLSPGQDITKISLPSVLCHPFSMLELISHRELLLFHILFELNHYTDPLERFMVVVKWFLGLVRSETMEKKPFNPVIGETHVCWVVNQLDEQNQPENITEFISEQVSHHPPVSAFFLRNAKYNITVEGATCFGVKLSTNSATVTTSGPVTVTTENEEFHLTKCVPDLNICNTVMPGKKYIIWTGEVKISCPQYGLVAAIYTEERYGRVNGIQGIVYHQNEPNKHIYRLDGVCGQKTYYWQSGKEKEKKILIDHSALKEAWIDYLPPHLRSEYDSLKLWVPVADAIIKNDMARADLEKKKIEADQRIRQAEKFGAGKQDEGIHFKRDPDSLSAMWQFRYNVFIMEMIKNGSTIRPPDPIPVHVPQPEETGLSNPNSPREEDIISEPEQIPNQSVADGVPMPVTAPVNNDNIVKPPQIPAPDTEPVTNPTEQSTVVTNPSPSDNSTTHETSVDQTEDTEKSREQKKKELKELEKKIVSKARELKGGLIPTQDIMKT